LDEGRPQGKCKILFRKVNWENKLGAFLRRIIYENYFGDYL
jgi:hypothetical protein